MTQVEASPAPRKRRFPIVSALLLAAGAWYYFAEALPSDPAINAGRDAVELHVFNHAGWNWPVDCRAGTYQTNATVFCYPFRGPRVGGLFIIGTESGQPVVYPINDKAMIYTKGFGTIAALNGGHLSLRPWRGSVVDISKAIETATDHW